MIERFEGQEGFKRLVEAIRRQPVALNEQTIALAFAESCSLRQYSQGTALITQNATDNDICLILSGSVSIQIHGREIARRKAGQHVGELALIDPGASRSADVVSIDTVVVARIAEPTFTHLAEKHPRLWRVLALEIGERLRQRSSHVIAKNEQPHIFIGSSTESLLIAKALREGLSSDPYTLSLWTNGVFGASRFPIEDLEREAKQADFAALVLGPDDKVVSRDVEYTAPRDNVIFELGLFMGASARRRVFIVYPRNLVLKIPTDLLGLTPIHYVDDGKDDLLTRLKPACTEIRKVIAELGPK